MVNDKYYVDPANTVDTTTLSNCGQVQPKHVHLEWTIDFSKKTLSGSVTHYFDSVEGLKTIDFDSSALKIERAYFKGKEETTEVDVKLHAPHKALGQRVSLEVPAGCAGGEAAVTIVYSTSPGASAIQWTDAAATADKVRPYVYTQCQAIHARSLMPCMDSPGIKASYTANVQAPEWCTVLMSALGEGESTGTNGMKTYKFKQPVPTPAYLVALVGGRLASRDISKRCRVWAEPSVVEDAAFDFSETEDFLQAAESLTCPYMWTRYDVLCLPPSFPYGGMENPCLTFVTPTLLTGDKSLADVVAHEIAHSWTGNLVTNKTWNHFFLNEGWTMWLQRKIEQKIKGGKDHFNLSAESGWSHLKDDIALFGADHPFTCLVCPLGEGDPDDSFSSVPYEKGFNLLYMLECIVGSENFEAFAKEYLQRFKYSTVTSDAFRLFFLEYFATPLSPAKDSRLVKNVPKINEAQMEKIVALDWQDLFHSPGMPKFTPLFSNPLSDAAHTLGQKWISTGSSKRTAADIKGWSVQQILIFLDALLEHASVWGPLSDSTLRSLDEAYSFTVSTNSEIKFKWQTLCIKSEAEFIIPFVLKFMTSAGRMKFARPLYRSLGSSKMGAQLARDTFLKHQSMYHPIARKMIKSDLNKINGGDIEAAKQVSKGFIMSSAVAASFFVAALLTA